MSQTVTLEIPDQVFQPLLRLARATRQPVESLLLAALQISLPSLAGLPDEIVRNLEQLEALGDDELWEVMGEQVPAAEQEAIGGLLSVQQERPLSAIEQDGLGSLQRQADLVMLRKARAAVLLRLRGKRVPTVAELERRRQQAA
jgi:hypothetical protein